MTPQTSNAVRESIVNWLQVPENFRLITGAAGFSSPVVSGTKLKKKDAHESLAKFVNQKHKTAFSATEMKRKYDWLLSQYKKAKDLSKTDVNPEQIQKKCPFYKEIDALFKDRQNISPYDVFEPITIPETSKNVNDEENNLSSSLESVHITEQTKNNDNQVQNSQKKRKADEDESEPQSPVKKSQKRSKDDSPLNSKTTSSGKQNFTASYVANQKEKFKMEKEIKEEELKLQKEKIDLETKFKDKELEFQKDKNDKEIQLLKEKSDKEILWKEKELEANIKLREKELESQQEMKKSELQQAKIQFMKEMLSQGKSKEEIKELLELLE